MDNSGFIPVNFGMNVGNNIVSSSGQIIQQFPGLQQIIAQNASAKPAGTPQSIQPQSASSQPTASHPTELAQAALQSVLNPQTCNQSMFGQQQQQYVAQQPGLQQFIGQRGIYATNYQLVPRNYALINQNVQGTGVAVQLSPQQMGTNITASVSPLDQQQQQQQIIQGATFDAQLSLQNPNQQISFQNANGQLTLQSPSQQVAIQSPTNQITLQSPTQHIAIQNQNQFTIQNQNMAQLNVPMLPPGQSNSVIVQGQGGGVIVQGDTLLQQNQGHSVFVQGQGFPNFNQPNIAHGQMFTSIPNIGSSVLPNQIQGLYTQASIVNSAANSGSGMASTSHTPVFKVNDNGNQMRPRLENVQKKATHTVQNVQGLNPQMQLLAQIANQGLAGITTSQTTNPLLTMSPQSPALANLVQQQNPGPGALTNPNQALPSFGHFLLHHHQQQTLPHPFLQNIQTLGINPGGMTNIINSQNVQNIPAGNIISTQGFTNNPISLGQPISHTGTAQINTGPNIQASPQSNNLNADFNNWNIGQFVNAIQKQAGTVGNPTGPNPNSIEAQLGPAALSGGKPQTHIPLPMTSVAPKSQNTVHTSNVISTGVVSTLSNMIPQSSATSVTYGVNTVTTSKIMSHTASTYATDSVMSRQALAAAKLVTGQLVKQEVDMKMDPGVCNINSSPTSTSIIVPYGWVRALEGDFIVYYSPTCARLTTLQSIKQYLSTDGTCKCGLECPLIVEKVFNFDTSVISVKWYPSKTGTENMGELCNHRRKNIALASLQLGRTGHLETALVRNTDLITSPRMISAVQEKDPKKFAQQLITPSGFVAAGLMRPSSADMSAGIEEKHFWMSTSPVTTGTSVCVVSPSSADKTVVSQTSTGIKASLPKPSKMPDSQNLDLKQSLTNKCCDSNSKASKVVNNEKVGFSKKVEKLCTTAEASSSVGRVESGTTMTSVNKTVTSAKLSLAGNTTPVAGVKGCDQNVNSLTSAVLEQDVQDILKVTASSKIDTNKNSSQSKVCVSVCEKKSVSQAPLTVDVNLGASTATQPDSSITNAKQSKVANPKGSPHKAKSPAAKLNTARCSNFTSPIRNRSSSSRSSTCSRLSSSELTSPLSERSSSRNSDKDHSPRGDFNIHPDTFTQFMNYFGFEPLNSPPMFRQGLPAAAVMNKMSAIKPLSPLMTGELTSVGVKSSVLANSMSPYSADLIANLHKISSPPNQQVFPSPLGLPGLNLPGDNTQALYQHGASLSHRGPPLPAMPGAQYLLPMTDLGIQVPMGNQPGCNTMADFVWLSPKKQSKSKKPAKPRTKKEQKKATDIFESDSPPPNVDVSQLKDKGHGPIPKQKIASFLENPTEFLKQQTEMVNSSISSTCASPKAVDPESSEPSVTIERSESADSERNVVTKRSESANSDRICSPFRNDEAKAVCDETPENDSPSSDVSNSNVNEIDSAKTDILICQGVQTSRESHIAGVVISNSKSAASIPHTPTTVVHYTPMSLSCHQLSLNKAKQHVQASTDSKPDVATKPASCHPLQTLFSDRTVGQAFQEMFPQFMQEALLESIGLGNISAALLANQLGSQANPILNLPGQESVPSSLGLTRIPGLHTVPGSGTKPAVSVQGPNQAAQTVSGPLNNVSIQQLLASQTKGDFPASNLLSAAAKAQLLQQQSQLSMLMAQQMGGQIINPLLNPQNLGNPTGNRPPANIAPATGESTAVQIPMTDSGTVSYSDNVAFKPATASGISSQPSSTNGTAVIPASTLVTSSIVNQDVHAERPKVHKTGPVKISELLSKSDPDRMKQKSVPVSSAGAPGSVDIPQPIPRVEHKKVLSAYENQRHLESPCTHPMMQHIQLQQQQQQPTLQANLIPASQLPAGVSSIPNYPQIGVNMNQLIMSQMQAAMSNTQQSSSGQQPQPAAISPPEMIPNQPLINPQLIHMCNTLGVPINGNFASSTHTLGQSIDMSQASGNAVLLGQLGQLQQGQLGQLQQGQLAQLQQLQQGQLAQLQPGQLQQGQLQQGQIHQGQLQQGQIQQGQLQQGQIQGQLQQGQIQQGQLQQGQLQQGQIQQGQLHQGQIQQGQLQQGQLQQPPTMLPGMNGTPSAGNSSSPVALPNINNSVVLEGAQVPSNSVTQDVNHVVNGMLPLVANVNGNQVVLNMPGLHGIQHQQQSFTPDGRTFVNVHPGMPLQPHSIPATSTSAPVMVVQNNQPPGVQAHAQNQISISNNDKATMQHLTLTNQGIDIQNIYPSNNNTPTNTPNMANTSALSNANQIMPLNLINVQQSFAGNSSNLTAMQLQTLQLQQQLLQQIQQVQGMQSLINQCNMQGNSPQSTEKQAVSNVPLPSVPAVQGAAPVAITASAAAAGSPRSAVIKTTSSTSDSVLHSALQRAGLVSVASLGRSPREAPDTIPISETRESLVSRVTTTTLDSRPASGASVVSSTNTSVSSRTPSVAITLETNTTDETNTLRKGNRIIAAADTTDDCHTSTKTVDIGTETDALDDDDDDDESADDKVHVERSNTHEVNSSRTEQSKINERSNESKKFSVTHTVTPQVNTCLAIATQKGNTKSLKMDSKLMESKSVASCRNTDLSVDGNKNIGEELKLRISRKHLLGSTVSNIISKPKKPKLCMEQEREAKPKFEKKELRSSTVAATKASTSAAASSSSSSVENDNVSSVKPDNIKGECKKALSVYDTYRYLEPSCSQASDSGVSSASNKPGQNEEVISSCSSGIDSADNDNCFKKETRKRSDLKEKLKDVVVCDSSVKEAESSICEVKNNPQSSISDDKEKGQTELTSKIAAALSIHRGRWQLSSQSSQKGAATSSQSEESSDKLEAIGSDSEITEGDTERQSSYSVEKGLKRSRQSADTSDTETTDNDECDDEPDPVVVQYPRSFNTGDLVWGQIRGFPSWPGKLVDQNDKKLGLKAEEGKLLVQWFGDHTITQVEPNKLKTLSEGLEAHHRARRKHRRGRKMNTNLEQAIQQAMAELDRQSTDELASPKPAIDNKLHRPVKKKLKK